ncbi:hypothetical protein CASFOL_039779 [Castilleja foliolosa]|uniref:Uncharacterized protein n=1 Tax=Castilleja foliolosa TaxID=1961234 RepID=A0ABD3BGK9_9LAMI
MVAAGSAHHAEEDGGPQGESSVRVRWAELEIERGIIIVSGGR